MTFKPLLRAMLFACVFIARSAFADGTAARASEHAGTASGSSHGVHALIARALSLTGIRYNSGGNSSATGFDCSGFVGHVFRESRGLLLPRTAREISLKGLAVARNELKPGDLVFFHTMRDTFSHVGIYLGDNRFVHAPRSGQRVGIADMRESYWARRYNGARRVSGD